MLREVWKSFFVAGVRGMRGAFKSRRYGAGPIEVPLTADHYRVKRGDFASVRTLIVFPDIKGIFR